MNQILTLNMIVKNEEALLARCLRSVKDFVDHIIIVDTGSTDRTIEIAKSYGAQVEHFEWIDDFSAARNYALSFVQTPWTLWLDADDIVINPEILPELCETGRRKRIDGWWGHYHQDEQTFQKRLQLFKTKKIYWGGVIHENPHPKNKITTLTDYCGLVVHHKKPIDRRLEAAGKYLDILLKKDPDNHFGLAESYRSLAFQNYRIEFDSDDAKQTFLDYAQKAVDCYWNAYHFPDANNGTKYYSLVKVCEIGYLIAAETKDAVMFADLFKVAQLGRQLYPDRAEAIFFQGRIAEGLRNHDDARYYYELAMSKTPPHNDTGLVNFQCYDELPKQFLNRLNNEMDLTRYAQKKPTTTSSVE